MMSKPRYNWWGHAKAIVRSYPDLQAEDADLHQQKLTPTYDGMPKGAGDGRGLENNALRELPLCKQRELDGNRDHEEAAVWTGSAADD